MFDLTGIEELRKVRHQRDAKVGRLVRIPFHTAFPQFKRPELVDPNWEPHPELVGAILCWVPKDHYVVALSSDSIMRGDGSKFITVAAGVCVDA